MADTFVASSSLQAVVSRSDEVVLRMRNLSKRYGQRLAVDNLSMEVRRGDIFGFLGPNGAGKTTTIRMALGLIAPTAGQVEILGRDVATHRASVLPRVGALIETPALRLYMSGRNNLRSFGAVLGGVSPKRIDTVLDLVGLANRQNDRVRAYSLGMKQRLGIAIALLNDPDVLILDEPANGLDPAGIVEIRNLMRNLAAAGKTIFISSHVLAEVQQLCTHIAIINQGQLITEATVAELTHGQGEYVVVVEQVGEALRLVQQQPWGKGASIDEQGRLLTAAPEGLGRYLTQFLASHGFFPDRLTYRGESLEEVFLRLTRTNTGGTQA